MVGSWHLLDLTSNHSSPHSFHPGHTVLLLRVPTTGQALRHLMACALAILSARNALPFVFTMRARCQGCCIGQREESSRGHMLTVGFFLCFSFRSDGENSRTVRSVPPFFSSAWKLGQGLGWGPLACHFGIHGRGGGQLQGFCPTGIRGGEGASVGRGLKTLP